MKFSRRQLHAFSLVELTLALGVAAFCLIGVFGLVPVGVQTNRNATSQTAATNILSSVVSDIRGSLPGQNQSQIYRIARNKNAKKTLYFDAEGQCSTDLAGSIRPDGSAWSPPLKTRYRLYVQIGPNNPGAVAYAAYAYLRVSWPAAADPLGSPKVTPSGLVETVAAYFVQ